MTNLPTRFTPAWRPSFGRLILVAVAAVFAVTTFAAEVVRKAFDIPIDVAAVSLKRFSQQSGVDVVFGTVSASQTRTNAVQGTFAPREALDRLLAGTGLTAVVDPATGAATVSRTDAPAGRKDTNGREPNPAGRGGAAETGTGAIMGRVENGATGNFLGNVRVTVQGTALEGFTNAYGEYRFDRVPAGPQILTAAISGYGAKSVRVEVGRDNAPVNFTLLPGVAAASAAQATASVSAGSNLGDEAVQLSAFTVSEEKATGYESTSTLSGTRTNERLRDLPMGVSILNQDLLRDLGVTDIFAMSPYALNVEFDNKVYGIQQSNGDGGGNSLKIRGISTSWVTRDGFIWYVPADTFNTETAEVNRGPSGLVFGDARAGGIINLTTKQASRRDAGQLSLRTDSEGSVRAILDVNRRLGARAAIRLNLLHSDLRDWRDTAFNQTLGVALSANYDINPDNRVRVSAEWGDINKVPTRGRLADRFTLSGYVRGSGRNTPGNPPGTTVLAGAGNTQRWTLIDGRLYNLESTGNAAGTAPGVYFRTTTVATTNLFDVAETIVPAHQQWNGPSERYDNTFYTHTVAWEHRVARDTAIELAYNFQKVDRWDVATNPDGVYLDPNPFLPGPGGTLVPNARYEEPYLDYRITCNRSRNDLLNGRLTGLHQFNLWGQRQRLIGNLSLREDRARWDVLQEQMTPEALAALGVAGAELRTSFNPIRYRHYLKDGNDAALRWVLQPDRARLYKFPGGTRYMIRQLSASLLHIGRFWHDRVVTTVGVRRDGYEQRNIPYETNPETGLAQLGRDASGALRWERAANKYRNIYNYGAVLAPVPWARVFANYADNFRFTTNVTPYFNREPRLLLASEGVDGGFSTYLFSDRLTATVTWFKNSALNEGQTATTALVNDEINALLGTSYTDTGDTRSRAARGHEIELVANPTRGWTLSVKFAARRNRNEEIAPRLGAVLARMKAVATNPVQYQRTEVQYQSLLLENASARDSFNFATRYTFTTGRLKGLRLGASGFRQPGELVEIANRPPLSVAGFTMLNFFGGYEHRLTPRLRWDLQLNVDNVLGLHTRVGRNYFGTSFLPPTKLSLTNSFSF
jgi:outer membrane receptor protein involved in Fe transport